MAAINPYLNFNGNAEEVFNFYKSILGGEFDYLMRWKEMPGAEKFSEEDQNKIMHISIPFGRDHYLLGCDNLKAMSPEPVVGTNFQLALSVDSRAEADRVFGALSEGASDIMPLSDTFWGSYFGMLTDKYRTQWMVMYDEPKA